MGFHLETIQNTTMRIKQTARKSTASRDASSSRDALRHRQRILETKRASSSGTTVPKKENPPARHSLPAAPSRGKQITFSSRDESSRVRVKPRARPGQAALREIRALQKTWNLQIPRVAFHRLVREITQSIYSEAGTQCDVRYQCAALEALQEATESYLIGVFEDSYRCTIHAKRVTLFPADMELCRKLRHGV